MEIYQMPFLVLLHGELSSLVSSMLNSEKSEGKTDFIFAKMSLHSNTDNKSQPVFQSTQSWKSHVLHLTLSKCSSCSSLIEN